MNMNILRCKQCGNLVCLLEDSGVPLVCCGKTMERMIPNTEDASVEKHVPLVHIDGNKVTVQIGEARHPMTEVHYIQWVALTQGQKTQWVELKFSDEPVAEFTLDLYRKEEFSVFAYCNLHGLWKKNVDN